MWVCPYCNEINSKEKSNCSFCGCKKSVKKNKLVIVVIAIVLALLIIAISVMLLLPQKQETEITTMQENNSYTPAPTYTPLPQQTPVPTDTNNFSEKF